MTNISIKQNEEKQIQRLAAQRELYNAAKRFQLTQSILTVLIPIILALVCIKFNFLKPYAALYGLIFSLLDTFLFDRIIKSKKQDAAKIQELFDCDVLDLNSSPLKSADDISVELVLTKYHAHGKTANNIESLKDWYPIAVDQLPMHLARLVCQRTNCYWDSRLRKRYANWILGFAVVLVMLFFTCQMLYNRTVIEMVLLLNTLLPLLKFAIKQHLDQYDAANRLDKLVAFAKTIWNSCNVKSLDEISDLSRRLQDEIYEHRSRSPLILNFLYNLLRSKDEIIMNSTADALIKDAKEKNLY